MVQFYCTEKQNPVSNEKKYLNEAAALGKLIVPSTSNGMVESTTVPNNNPLKVRANNPFKKRKHETNSGQVGSNTKQVSTATEVEILDTLCVSTSNITSIVLSDSPPRKRKNDIHLDDIESESSQEQISEVTSTQIESPDILSATSESQDSVNSKLPKGKRMVKNDKLNRNSCSENKKGSILNFFSPV